MSNFMILYIPVRLKLRSGEDMSPNEEIQIVHDMINRYNVLKGKGVFGEQQDTTEDRGRRRSEFSTSRPTDTTGNTQTVLSNIATFLESKPAPTYRLKQVVGIIMTDAKVENFLWQKTNNDMLWQLTAILNPIQSDHLGIIMKDIGLLSLQEVSMNFVTVNYTSNEDKLDNYLGYGKDSTGLLQWHAFLSSIKARITLAEVANVVKKNAQFTFDFLVLICIASIIATVGLIENSMVNIVASMLISPMMGPILAIAFGITITNKDLMIIGVRNEMLCFFICIFFGFIFGLFMARLNLRGAYWGLSSSWPTPEMAVRGLFHTLAMGCIVAIVSGAGVCISILGGNVSTMVGVAISASLLPPTVNAGLLWGHSLMWLIQEPEYDTNTTSGQILKCTPLANNGYQFQYSCNPSVELFILGNLSLSLAAVNIFCIILSGVFMLRVKEIVPRFVSSTPTDYFFKSQIALMREKLSKEEMTSKDFSDFSASFSEFYNRLETDQEKLEFIVKWQKAVRDLEKDPLYIKTMKNMPEEVINMFKAGKLELDDFSKSSPHVKPAMYFHSIEVNSPNHLPSFSSTCRSSNND